MRRRLITGLLATALLLVACNGEEPPPPDPGPTGVAPTPGPTATGGLPEIDVADIAVPVEDATALRDELLRIAPIVAQPEPGEALNPDFGVVSAWVEAFPDLTFSGGAVPPDTGTVSVYGNVQNSKETVGEDNPYVLAAAILDTEGNCAGLVMAGYPSLEDFVPVDDPSRCDPFTVAAEGGYETFG